MHFCVSPMNVLISLAHIPCAVRVLHERAHHLESQPSPLSMLPMNVLITSTRNPCALRISTALAHCESSMYALINLDSQILRPTDRPSCVQSSRAHGRCRFRTKKSTTRIQEAAGGGCTAKRPIGSTRQPKTYTSMPLKACLDASMLPQARGRW